MPYSVEVQSEQKDGFLWRPVGEAASHDEAGELFDEVCAANEGCAVILRGELGEVVVKRSVFPAGLDGGV